MAINKILVIGGTGFIGRAIVKRLKNEYNVTTFGRSQGVGKHIVGDLLNRESLLGFREFDIVINLASVVRAFNKSRYKENIIGLKNLISALDKKAKLIYFSTQNVNLRKKGPYASSKVLCEKLLRNSNLNFMIVRPNYVYDIGKKNDFYKMTRIGERFGIVPIIGNGENKIEPIFLGDLADVVSGLVRDFHSGATIEVSGKESWSLNEIVLKIGEMKGRRVRAMHFPVGLAGLFKFIVPFDVEGSCEGRESEKPYPNKEFSSFGEDLRKIVELNLEKINHKV